MFASLALLVLEQLGELAYSADDATRADCRNVLWTALMQTPLQATLKRDLIERLITALH